MSMSSLNQESHLRQKSDEESLDENDQVKENGMHDINNEHWVCENVEVNTEPEQQMDIKPNISILEGMEFVQHPLPSEQTQEIDPLYSSNENEIATPPMPIPPPPPPVRHFHPQPMEISPQMAKDLESLKLNPDELEHFKHVVKMDTYLAKGRRPQFWEEPFTKKVGFMIWKLS